MANLIAAKSVSFLNRPLKVDFKDLFKALAKAGLSGATRNSDGVWESLIDVGTAIGLGQDPAQIAWLLIYRSLERAICSLLRDNFDLLVFHPVMETLPECLNKLESAEISIDENFFNQPKQLPILAEVQPALAEWLQLFGVDVAQAQAMSDRLPSYFSHALEEEWQARPEQYNCLLELYTPFTKANDRERAWRRYRAYLQQQVAKPMFGEAFSLQQVYVPLRAYFTRKKPSKQTESGRNRDDSERDNVEKVVVNLDTAIQEWLDKADKADALRVICGGPGCGKSSSTQILAARLAEKSPLPVVYIPLHLFKPDGDLSDALEEYFAKGLYEILPPNPLENKAPEPRTLLIFDGLDELAMQGKFGTELAQQFVMEVKDKLRRLNEEKLHLQVLISGRDLAVQSSGKYLTQDGQVLHVLPYFLPESSREEYVDSIKLLEQDQREIWWQTYGKVSGQSYDSLPPKLASENLVEITAQPLLNYLVALSLKDDDQRINFSDETNLNQIYAHLLQSVYKRGWASGRQHPALEGIEEQDFIRILEEIALSTWHGDGRTTSVKAIEAHCQASRLGGLLKQIQQGAEAGVMRLLAAFYFRQQGRLSDGEKTFEFTHKSFGEYLTARRIVSELNSIHDELQLGKQSYSKGLDEKQCLEKWAILCGTTPIDQYLLTFIWNEVANFSQDSVAEWQKTLSHLISVMLKQGMPMEKLDPRPNFFEENRQARNAEEALLCVLYACARHTKSISKIEWDNKPEILGTWINRLRGQRLNFEDSPVSLISLGFLDMRNCIFIDANLFNVNLINVDLQEANLQWANLIGANLEGANLIDADLIGANLEGANLIDADLEGANLIGANLIGAKLEEANLGGANLEGAKLQWANLIGANLEGANLEGAKLEEANLGGANLQGANLEGANLGGANLTNVYWDNDTNWKDVRDLETARYVPLKLLEELSVQGSGRFDTEQAEDSN